MSKRDRQSVEPDNIMDTGMSADQRSKVIKEREFDALEDVPETKVLAFRYIRNKIEIKIKCIDKKVRECVQVIR